jgi:hypothetical protein
LRSGTLADVKVQIEDVVRHLNERFVKAPNSHRRVVRVCIGRKLISVSRGKSTNLMP